MHKFLISGLALFISFTLFTVTSFAQTVSYVDDTLHITAHVGEDDVAHGDIINTTTSSTELRWRRVVENVTSGGSAICDVNLCYGQSVSMADFSLSLGDTGTMDVHFYVEEYSLDTNEVHVIVFDPDDSLNTVKRGVFYATISPITATRPELVTIPIAQDTGSTSAWVTNFSTDTMNLEWSVIDVEDNLADIEFCMDDECMGITSATSGTFSILPNDSMQAIAKFDYTGQNGATGISSVRISFQDPNDAENINTADKSFIANFTKSTAVETIDNYFIEVYPNPINNFLYLKDPKQVIQKVEVYNIVGKKVLTENNINGKVDLTSLPANSAYIINLYDANNQLLYKTVFHKF